MLQKRSWTPCWTRPPTKSNCVFPNFHEPSERPSLGRLRLSLQPCCGQNCSHFPVGPTSPSESNHVFQLFFSAPLLNPVSDPCFPFSITRKSTKTRRNYSRALSMSLHRPGYSMMHALQGVTERMLAHVLAYAIGMRIWCMAVGASCSRQAW